MATRRQRRNRLILFIIIIFILSGSGLTAFILSSNDKQVDDSFGSIHDVHLDQSFDNPKKEIGYEQVDVHIISVGEGSATLIDAGETEIIVDGGYSKYGKKLSNYINKYVDGQIEYVIATHSDADHVGGLSQIYRDYDVKTTIYGDIGTSKQYKAFEKLAKEQSEWINDSDTIIELTNTANLTIYDPIDNDKNSNNNSVVAVLNYNDKRLFTAGDIEKETEQLLRGKIGRVDVYVVSHHGADTSSSDTFVKELSPKQCIISCAAPNKNKYGHPHPNVLNRLLGKEIYATYVSGNIIVSFTGDDINFSCPREESVNIKNYKTILKDLKKAS